MPEEDAAGPNAVARDADVPPSGSRKRKQRELTPTQRALALLVRREHSRKELARKLAERGIESEAASAAIERLTGDGWQSDARFAELLVRTRAAHGQGPIRIRAELGTHGLDGDTIETAMQAFDGDWRQAAQDLVRRRFGLELASADPVQRRKAADFLYRRGFDGDTVRSALRGDLQD
ncbi:recombination regulator RecX [Pseudoxanthomonas sacheonensis]|uniref:recombination regulator RecX n=1 Tax=Pseudoxanthomonas sacheonensis TaxID=443615 RepID=UPI0013D43FD2|nr:recombination regulator RecX [Pseudoxanthomonas sacheonensis]KAF1706856.1 recombination regulator RecX [Pseudoxanthomonas sacheonensis]